VHKTTSALIAVVLLLNVCTTRGVYEGIRRGARNECYNKLSQEERDRCLARTRAGYDQYQRERDESMKSDQDPTSEPHG